MNFPFVDVGAPFVVGSVPASVVVSKDQELLLFLHTVEMVCALFCICSLLMIWVLVDGFVGL